MRYLLALLFLTVGALAQPFTANDPSFMQSTSPLRVGLSGYWRLEEASGTRYDCSKNGNHLTSNNSVGQTAGKVGNCSSFNGSNQRLTVASNSSLQTGNANFTIAAWVNFADLSATSAVITKHDGATFAGSEYFLGFIGGTSRLQFDVYNSSAGSLVNADNLGAPSVLTWYFIVAWFDRAASTISIQVNNGTANTTSSVVASVNSTSTAFNIGSFGNGSSFINGYVDEPGFWKRILTAAERTQLYNAGLGTHFPWSHP